MVGSTGFDGLSPVPKHCTLIHPMHCLRRHAARRACQCNDDPNTCLQLQHMARSTSSAIMRAEVDVIELGSSTHSTLVLHVPYDEAMLLTCTGDQQLVIKCCTETRMEQQLRLWHPAQAQSVPQLLAGGADSPGLPCDAT